MLLPIWLNSNGEYTFIMKELVLKSGEIVLVDDEDYELVKSYDWALRGRYATTTIFMHRLIAKPDPSKVVDHIDGNSLDNRRSNLRIATKQQNAQNRRPNRNATSSKYKGVTWHRHSGKWNSKITVDGRRIHLGYFDDEAEAAQAYDKAAIKFHKEFALLNFKE